MYIPSLVETQVKQVLHHNLKECHNIKFQFQSFLFNFVCFVFIISLIGTICYFKYKGHKDEKERIKKENQKRDYILYNLRKFQNMKNKHLTNIPLD